ncbi:unnamed protein product [Rotaria sp. Silwood1]|nr:unnamed protein product [Rotaria sp. Silwood1]CAF3338704.1 unnamed protein product [Rotaria sp. Silwood1]CAF4712612.1 unnamed protein product [Rotaria sp. Silwood1]CAF4919144.1 unnamed protein product [Rotaria sp. Silwood1]
MIVLDLTERDFRSSPSLSFYVQHWFIDIDNFIDFILNSIHNQITLIVSPLLANIVYYVIRPIFSQITRIIIVGNCLCCCEYVEHFKDTQSLVDSIYINIQERRRLYITFDSWPNERSTLDLNLDTARFLWYKYYFNILSRLQNTSIARCEMLESVRAFHKKQIDTVKRTCEEFERTYNSKDILRWYTRNSFCYLLLNRTLRSEDINHIFAMRYIIYDLENCFTRNYHEQTDDQIDIVYRGQQMHPSEIQKIDMNIGGLIGLTAFWSTTRSLEKAFHFTEIWPRNRSDPVERVLFKIRIPPDIQQAVFMDISKFSTIECELEVLFSFRALFRVEEVVKNVHKNIWFVDLTLIDENDNQFLSIMQPWYLNTQNIISQRSFFISDIELPKKDFFRNSTDHSAPFLAFQLLIDMMLRLDRTGFARDELLEVCRERYSHDSIELQRIDHFEQTYDAKHAIKWYTTDCFIYRIINESLRNESIDLIFKLRYFINDLHNELAQMQSNFLSLLSPNLSVLTLYRGLKMDWNQLEELRRNKGNLVSTNSFLSTTSDYEAACFFAGDGSVDQDDVSVIFEISVNTKVKHSIPFAKIDYKSIFEHEDEVLFSIGAVFRVGETEELRKRLWKVELTLTQTEDVQWNILTAHLNSK